MTVAIQLLGLDCCSLSPKQSDLGYCRPLQDAEPIMQPQRSLGHLLARSNLRLTLSLASQPSSQLCLLAEELGQSLEVPRTPTPDFGLPSPSRFSPFQTQHAWQPSVSVVARAPPQVVPQAFVAPRLQPVCIARYSCHSRGRCASMLVHAAHSSNCAMLVWT